MKLNWHFLFQYCLFKFPLPDSTRGLWLREQVSSKGEWTSLSFNVTNPAKPVKE